MAAPVLKAQHLGIQFGGLKAVDDFKKSLKDAMKHWNKLLDVIYDELCENDYEE